ncbi:MAG: SAM-dependent methyltransferase [Flavobacteriaceae bacterium]|nr:SAM-dependent methyltransferase [Flavobacteriaceae bacterium]
MTWEEAVDWMRKQPGLEQSVLDNYFETDLLGSAIRFEESEEFEETMEKVISYRLSVIGVDNRQHPTSLLDLGAGRGIASYAFAKQGFLVTSLEPDPSNDVGAGAIRQIAKEAGLHIEVLENWGESLPFADGKFDVVYVRQVLHHAHDLPKFLQECARVLKPGGVFMSTRDHVISGPEQMDGFLKNHGLHHLYGGENAFMLDEYQDAIERAGLYIKRQLGSYDSVINYAPMTKAKFRWNVESKLAKILTKPVAKMICDSAFFMKIVARMKSISDKLPGRLVSFIAIKP